MAVTANEVKELRARTGAGVMECKAALVAASGEMSKAEAALKERGIAIAKKRERRSTNQGRVFGLFSEELAALVELRCETDFVSENAEFLALGERCVGEVHALRLSEPNETIGSLVAEAVGRLKENIIVNSIHLLEAGTQGCLAGYVHDTGRYAALVRLAVEPGELRRNPRVRALAADLTLHVTAFAPQFTAPEEISEEYRAEYEREWRNEAEEAGKRGDMAQTIVAGKWRHHLERVCLVRQPFVRDEAVSVEEAVARVAREVGGAIVLDRFAYVGIAPAVCL